MLIKIKNRYTGVVLYSGDHESIKDAVVAGVKAKANLREANLYGANFLGADLRGCDLSGCDLREANLRGVDLRGCDLRGADLSGADLRWCDLRGCDLSGAYLSGAYLEPVTIARLSICPEGDLIGWNTIREGACKLLIPATAKRSNATGRKCRAEFAIVLELPEGCTEGHSVCDPKFIYRVGETVRPTEPFCEDRWQECASGIHFYITREEAEAHS